MTLVRCREVVPILEVDWLATSPGYKTLNQQISGDQKCSEWAKIDKTKEWTDYLSNKCQKFDLILMICASGFGLCPLSEVILYRLQGGDTT